MKADSKAEHLVNIFGKELALLCVDELITCDINWNTYLNEKLGTNRGYDSSYWQEVKTKIKKHEATDE